MRTGLLLCLCLTLFDPANLPGQTSHAEVERLIVNLQAHRRVALAYLRTENADLAAIEIERLIDRWKTDIAALTPAQMRDPELTAAMAETTNSVADSLAAVDQGDIPRARTLLEQATAPLTAWRRRMALRLFSDCIADAGSAYETLDVYRVATPDLKAPAVAKAIVDAAYAAAQAYLVCDREAQDNVRGEAEFRRLIDGMIGSLRQIPDAVAAGDGAFLHRLLIEQRAFERLLSFHYG